MSSRPVKPSPSTPGPMPRKHDLSAFARLANAEHRGPRKPGPRIRREHPRAGSRYELELARQIALEPIEPPVTQYRFAAELGRQYRFDFAWPPRKLAAEVDGGRWLIRRGKDGQPIPVGWHLHTEDYRKNNLAQKLGWTVLRFVPEMIRSGEAITEIRAVLVVPS